MNGLIHCISAELLKTGRTMQLLCVIAVPTVLSLLNFLLMLTTSRDGQYAVEDGWFSFAHNTITFGSMLVLPWLIVLLCAFSAHQEHDTKCWRILMILPLPKPAVYIGKLAVVAGLAALSCLILWAQNIIWGWLLSVLRPETGLSLARLTPCSLLAPYLLMLCFSLLLLAIHFWFSWRVRNFALAIGIGFFLVLLGSFLQGAATWRIVFPWSLPSLVHSASSWQEAIAGLVYSTAGFALIVHLACRDFVRHDVLV